MKQLKLQKWYLIGLIALGFLLYVNTLDHGYVLDDLSVISENFVTKQGLDGLGTIFTTHHRHGYGYTDGELYRPLTLSVFALQWQWAPNDPGFAHWFNVIFYAICGALLFLLLQKWLPKAPLWMILGICALFISHPIHTEVVANIKSFDEILAFFFVLLSFLSLWRYIDVKQSKWLIVSLLLFALAFLAKESTITILFILPLALYFFSNLNLKRILNISLLYLIPTFFYFALRKNALGTLSGGKKVAMIDNLLVAAPNLLVEKLTAIKILGMYFLKLIWPHPLMNDYSLHQISLSSAGDWRVWLSFLFYGALLYLAYRGLKGKKIWAFAILFYLVSLSLYSNLLFKIGTSFGERLLFFPSLGFCILLAWGAFKLLSPKAWEDRMSPKVATNAIALLSVVVLLYAYKTYDRNPAWKSNYSLYSTDVKNCDQSTRCHYYMGLTLVQDMAATARDEKTKKYYLNEAIKSYQRAIDIWPSYSDAHGQMGIAFYRLGLKDQAMASYQNSLKFNPNNYTSLSNMGTLYFEAQQYAQAKDAFERALRLNPNYVDALANLGSTLGTMGDFQNSIRYFLRAIELRPNEPSYYYYVSITYKSLGNEVMANQYMQRYNSMK